MGADQSAPEATPSKTTCKTHIGNYMEKDVEVWQEAQRSSAKKDEEGCGCDVQKPRMNPPPYMGEAVQTWETMHLGLQ